MNLTKSAYNLKSYSNFLIIKVRALCADDDGGGWKEAVAGWDEIAFPFFLLTLLALWFLNFVEAGDVQARLSFQSPSTLASSSCLLSFSR